MERLQQIGARWLASLAAGSVTWLMVVIAVLSFLALSGCGGGGNPGSSAGAGQGGGGSVPASTNVHATEAGTPQGQAASAVIGAAGGQLTSADGGLTIEVPAGAFSSDQTLTIQPITNQAHGGVANAYRITPEGLHTTVPMTLRFHFTDADTSNTAPGFLGVAYQDAQGLWQAYRSRTLDAANRTLTVQTTHFSDWSMFSGVQLRPPQGTVHVGQTLTLQLMACEQEAEGLLVSILHKCQQWDPDDRTVFWSVNGTLGGGAQSGTVADLASTDSRNDAVYTAPAHVPNGNSMVVAVSAELFNPQRPDEPTIIMVSNITVEDELARSCEWLRTAGDLRFSVDFGPASYSTSDGYVTYTGAQRAHFTGTLKSQAQTQPLGWWVSNAASLTGTASINDLSLSEAVRTTTVGAGAIDAGTGDMGVVLYVDYADCSYKLTVSAAVMATVTDTYLLAENPPDVSNKVVRLGTLGLDNQPLYATYSVTRSIHAERSVPIRGEIVPGVSAYAPTGWWGTLQSGDDVAASWTITPATP